MGSEVYFWSLSAIILVYRDNKVSNMFPYLNWIEKSPSKRMVLGSTPSGNANFGELTERSNVLAWKARERRKAFQRFESSIHRQFKYQKIYYESTKNVCGCVHGNYAWMDLFFILSYVNGLDIL